MMAKIKQGSSFSGVINYVLNRDEASLLVTKGIRQGDNNTMANSFDIHAKLSKISKPVAHISLNFSAQDIAKLTDDKMVEIAFEYLANMGYGNTQFLLARHTDREHPHCHIVINRIDVDGKRISDKNEKLRNSKICRELTERHGLYIASGKEHIKLDRLREPEKTKHQIYNSIARNLPQSKSWQELEMRLRADGVTLEFKTKGSTSIVEGIRFSMNRKTISGSKVDKHFSYSKIDNALNQNARTELKELQSCDQNKPFDLDAMHSALSLFDFPVNSGDDYEEDNFRHRMQQQQKKRKGRKL